MTTEPENRAPFPPARPWRSRLLALPALPGPIDGWLSGLRTCLETIENQDLSADATLTWADEKATLVNGEWLSHRLVPIGLLRRSDVRYLELTNEAHEWLNSEDPNYLIGVIHSRVRFVGEILRLVQHSLHTHETLLATANSDYQLNWSSLDQVRRRTNWLRAANLLELKTWSNNELAITTAGSDLVARLNVAEPDATPSGPDAPTEDEQIIPPPTPAIAKLVGSLDQDRLLNRKRSIGFIPGGKDGETLVDSMHRLVTVCTPRITKEEFRRVCADDLALSQSSADTCLFGLRSTGLVQQIAMDTYEPTTWASSWLESTEPVDLIRILHSHIFLVAELIPLLMTPSDPGRLATTLQRSLGVDAPARSEITTRLRLLATCGLLSRVSHTDYAATTLGAAFSNSIPCLAVSGSDVTESFDEVHDITTSALDQLILELTEAGVDSRDSGRLERAVLHAMESLGFTARLLGGPGKSDVLVSVWIEPGRQRRVIIDAKTAGSGQVLEGAINFDAIEEHKARHDADAVAIVGPSFPGGRLAGWAKNRNIRLIDIPTLQGYLRSNKRAPLAPSRLAAIFDVETASPGQLWEAADRRHEVIRHVVSTLWREATDDREVARSGGYLDVNAFRYLLRDRLDPDTDELQEVLDFLTSPVLQSVKRKGDRYSPLEPPETTIAKLSALAVGAGDPRQDRGTTLLFESSGSGIVTAKTPAESDKELLDEANVADPAAVRAWAQATGKMVRASGRLPTKLVEEYQAARRPAH